MGKTKLSIYKEHFYINGKKTYSEIEYGTPSAHGLLMNARFVQGVFDDKSGSSRYNRFGRAFDPEGNTDALIAALPQWYEYGLRAFTVGFQGGGPCFTIDNTTIENNPFGVDGKTLDPAYAARMDRLIRAADNIGMAVIVSFFYGAQAGRLKDGRAVMDAVRTASRFLKEGGYSNVLIEVANEQDAYEYVCHPLLYTAEGMASLIELARIESGGLAVACSSLGGSLHREICEAGDYVLIHGNGCSRQTYCNLISSARQWAPDKPVICNEDSPAIGQLAVAYNTSTSWGYYNNLTKQEPPADWAITPGEDTFFACRMAEGLGIKLPLMPFEEQYYLQGLEPQMQYDGKRWIRVASLYPESINYVEFIRNGELVYTAYDEPFSLNWQANWLQAPWNVKEDNKDWRAVIHLRNGSIVEKGGEKSVISEG